MRISANQPGDRCPAGRELLARGPVEIEGGGLLFVSGQVALDAEGSEGDMARQADKVFENLKALLEANGGSFADVVKVSTFMTDISQVPAVRQVRARYLTDPPPASTTVEVTALVRPEFLIEVEVIAALPGRT